MDNKEIWRKAAVVLSEEGHSWRDVAQKLGKARSTVSDYLRDYYEQKTVAELWADEAKVEADDSGFYVESSKVVKNKDEGRTHLYIPDNQVKCGVDLDYLRWVGEYIVRKQPDVIVNAGDFADMESLSSYDKGKRTAEGKRVQNDIDVAVKGMKTLLTPLRNLQAEQRALGVTVYKPRMILTLGNHENRINRHVDANPELHGFLSVESLGFKEAGWEVVPFLTPIIVDGVAYCHYFPNNMTGKPLGGSALNMLKTVGCSFTQGHRQTLDVATRFLPSDGRQQWGVIAGACYTHNEDYKGVQGNHHWRGLILKHNVRDGSYDPLFISLDWLEKEYG